MFLGEWKVWFAWYPVRLLTMEIAWLRWVIYRHPAQGGDWAYFGTDYANPITDPKDWRYK